MQSIHRRQTAKWFVTSLVVAATSLVVASTAHAQGGADVSQCSRIYYPNVSGFIVISASGNMNFNCNPDGPAGGGGAYVARCSDFASVATKGNFVGTPSGATMQHCRVP